MFGVEFKIHGYELAEDFADWLGRVTLLDFALTVQDVGFAEAVNLVIAENEASTNA